MCAAESATNDDRLGLVASLLLHLLLVLVLYLVDALNFNTFKDPVVYSVTMEGGKELGGMSQAPDPKAKTAIAPPKNVQELEEKKALKEETQSQEKIKPLPEKTEEDAEVSLQEKQKEVEKKKQEEEKKRKELEKKKQEEDLKKKKEEEKKKLEEKKKKELEDQKKQAAAVNKNYQQALQRYLGESSNAGGKGFGAARLGGSGMGGGQVRPPEFFTYMKVLEQHIKSGWRWHDTNAPLVAQVLIDIEPDGTIRDVQLRQGSGNGLFDDSVVRAVRKSSPVPIPPETVYSYFKSVLLTFDPRQ